jgi:iron complex outermembrane receptor protein
MHHSAVTFSYSARPRGVVCYLQLSVLFALLTALLLAPAQGQAPAASGASIKGTLTVPPIFGNAITKASVTLVETGQVATVGPDGHFAFTAVAPGNYTLLASGDGFSRLRIAEVPANAGQVTDVGTREMPILLRDGIVQAGEQSTVSYRETDLLKMDRFVVTDAKPPAFQAGNSDIPRSENDVQPYHIITGEEMAFSGSLTVEDYLKEKLSMDGTSRSNDQIYTGGIGATSSISLRGLGPDRTLVLINGRRVQGTDQAVSNVYGVQPDLNSIPQVAIDHIEILPTGASGIYGASAIGGVINVVLKQNYNGGQVSATYQNSFNTDAPTRVANLLYGFSMDGGKTHVTLTGTFREVAPLLYQDQPDIALRGIKTILQRSPALLYSNVTPPSLGTSTNIALYTGAVAGSINDQSATLKLKDGTALNSLITNVPLGTTPTTANATLYAGLLANAGKYNLNIGADNGVYSLGNQIGQAPTVYAYSATLTRQMTPWLQLFADFRYGDNDSSQIYNRISRAVTYVVPATAPNNPFMENVAVHFPTNTPTILRTVTISEVGTVGATADLPGNWRAQLDASWSKNYHSFYSYVDDTASETSQLSSGAINPFVDTTLYPVDVSGSVATYQYQQQSFQEYIEARASGPLPWLALGSASPTLTAGAGYQISDFDYAQLHQRFPVNKASGDTDLIYLPQRSTTYHAYSEFEVPLIRPEKQIPLVKSLEVQAAGRYEGFSVGAGTPSVSKKISAIPPTTSYAAPTINGQPYFDTIDYGAMNYTAGLKYMPVSDLTSRLSWATAFIPPTQSQLIPAPLPTTTLTSITDPQSGATYGVETQGGGNRNLKPQNTTNWNFGLIWQPTTGTLQGLRLEANYFYLKEKDLITSLTPQQILGRPDLQDRITRDPATGRVTVVNTSLVNLSYYRMTGWDFSGAYRRTLSAIGTLSLSASGTLYNNYKKQIALDGPFLDYVGWPSSGGVPRFRGNSTFAWGKNGLTLGWTVRFIGSYGVYAAPGSPYYSTPAVALNTLYTNAQGGNTVASQIYHDIFGSYVFGKSGKEGSRLSKALLQGVTLKAGIRDLFNTPPPLDVFNSPYFYSYYGSAAMCQYWVTLSKDF